MARRRAVRAVRETNGEFITVSDDEILEAMPLLARGEAVFAEPAASAAYAGLLQAVRAQKIDRAETVVVVVTGNGLKDIRSAVRAAVPCSLFLKSMASSSCPPRMTWAINDRS